MTDDLAKVERKRNLQRDRDNHSLAEFKDVLKTYSGRSVFSAILKECDVDSPIPTHRLLTFRILGKRDVGLWLREKLLTLSSDSVILMENESRKRDEDLKI